MEIVMKKPTVPGAEKQGCECPPVYRGKPGPQGEAATIQIVDVVTIEPSDPARVENIGDNNNAKLILYIPKGDPGNRGEPGPAVEITEDIIQSIVNELDLTPELVGLGNVDNTSDMDKPLSNAQIEAFSSLALEIGSHVGNKNNPHDVTIEQIGAAPAGYGLGLSLPTPVTTVEELDTLVKNGWYTISCNATLAGVNFNHAAVFVQSRNTSIYQELVPIKSTTKLRRYKHNGVWSEWEVENPPMVLGVEYRTTKRYNENVVYMKAINCGAAPDSSGKTIAHGIANCRPIRCVGRITSSTNLIPYVSLSGARIDASANATNINVYATYAPTEASDVIALLEYYKV